MARGAFGQERAFIVRPSDTTAEMRTATDLSRHRRRVRRRRGQGRGQCYRASAPSRCQRDSETAQPLGFRPGVKSPPSHRVKGVLSRGDTQSLAEQADAAIYVADKREKYFEELQGFITGKNVVPSKYLYWTPQGSAHWLQFCELGQYKFYSDSKEILEQHAETVAQKIVEAAGSAELDFISIGSGDGVKDNLILRHLHTKLTQVSTSITIRLISAIC